jgi:Mrp family chromosome partitioning ATPase
MSFQMPQGRHAEATRSLRTSLQFLAVDAPIRRVVVTSAGPGEGKSHVASNLAAVYAQAGIRTVLVSADVRRPRIESMFGLPTRGPGLTDLIVRLADLDRGEARETTGRSRHDRDTVSDLSSLAVVGDSEQTLRGNGRDRRDTAVEEALIATSFPDLRILPAGSSSPNPAELMGSKQAADLLDRLSRLADVVILDTPPALVVTDALVLAEQSDGVLLVSALGETSREGLKRAKAALQSAHTRMLGVVLNKTTGDQGHYYYYYGADSSENADAPLTRKERSGRMRRRQPANL